MRYDPGSHVGRLPRLEREHYQGLSYVHWAMTIHDRATGWLDSTHHAVVRELLCHALSRFRLVCPAYCLMPDHAHFLWIGLDDESDQRGAAALFRRAWGAELRRKNRRLQRQAYDHVLRECERAHGALGSMIHYIFDNPVRAGIVNNWSKYEFLGVMVPGYPDLDPRSDTFSERFWRIHAKLNAGPLGGESLTASATL